MRALYVGNDVVDLEQPRTEGRSADERFVARVFDSDERAAIAAAGDADLELWTRWAAKEAGYKVISKLIGAPPPFVHRAFKVAWTESAPEIQSAETDVVRRGRVTYEDYDAAVMVSRCPNGVHAIGFGVSDVARSSVRLHPRVALLDAPGTLWSAPLEKLRARFTEPELDAVYSKQSAAVRLGARAHLARALQVEEARLEIVCDPGPTSQRPPRVLLDGSRADADVSLSHDGRWIAWVIWVPKETETT
ncbi:MAG: 4'-phosphopantetheinyl transferase superfamily protein [Gemmatimonadota bacterium]